MNEHIAKQFDADLENIRSRVLQMGGLVEQQIVRAFAALETGDLMLADEVVATDHDVNRHEVELDEACAHLIARRQPAASDLRMIMAVIKTITDLERVGDEAKKIAKRARTLHSGDMPFVPRVELRHVSATAVAMLRKALDAFARTDPTVSAQIARQDKEVDAEFKSIMRQLITFMMEDPRMISSSLEVLFIAKAIERIGDHAKNISEYVVYMVKGRDVRHIGLEAIEREAAEG
ncbi:phosphate signaling complex protein PhoU [Sulfurisoma sediminicola]|uniref:Phosphate-specific transport system accessory protein PhoU n=1 Tax=Sulfurisoma sediminicola TaxID=1381557 RepID=A0A497X960_9PROT|nr:phosphate signaling complex protein PhoU [Sulfurisoma sediminicola]RLJ62123.1 PhoU-like phosphate uptake regulator [Sulfurisoma sediminicola]